jgi:DNA-binding transcriptional regulator YiaG
MNGTQIRTLREEAVLSQEALARNLGVALGEWKFKAKSFGH